MFRSIFQPYGLVWTILNYITDVLLLSLLWCVCSLPLLTVGAATTALYDTIAHGMRNHEGEIYGRFFRTFRAELKTGVGFTLLWGVFLIFCSYVLALLEQIGAEDSRAAIMAGAYRVFMLFPLACACWSALILSRFTCGFRALIGTSIRYVLSHPLASLVIAVVTWVVFHYCMVYPLGLAFAPALCALVWTFAAEPVFRKYGAAMVAPWGQEEEG